jgi:predicted SprT family Zn-dependent metalloprotease
MEPTVPKRIQRSGVIFTCETCGKLLRDCPEHNPVDVGLMCVACRGSLRLVGNGEKTVQFAKWYRCTACGALFMRRRGELVPTGPRRGFETYA